MLHDLLRQKGMESRNERNDFLRGIKENRLKLYLGPVLKILVVSQSVKYGPTQRRLGWLNGRRNAVAHEGYRADYSTAANAIYACVKTLVVLGQHGLITSDFPVEMFRNAKITAAWAEDPPKWVPKGEDAESFTFN